MLELVRMVSKDRAETGEDEPSNEEREEEKYETICKTRNDL